MGCPEDVVTNLCNNFDGVPVPFSVCVQVAILNNGGIPRKQGPWVLSELDAPWDSRVTATTFTSQKMPGDPSSRPRRGQTAADFYNLVAHIDSLQSSMVS